MRTVLFLLVVLLLCVPGDASWLSDATGINIDLNKQVGTGIAAMGAPTIDAFGQTGQRLIDQMDQKLGARLTSITTFTDAEVTRVQGIVTESIRTIDSDIEENLNKADEILEKRLGNVDTIMTKSALTFEGVIRRLLLTGCIMVFVAVACWRIYKLGPNWGRLGYELSGVAASLVLLFAIFYILPHSDLNNLITQHMTSYQNSMRVLDFRQARYHAAQLRILDPGNDKYLALDNKATLLQDVLLRPVFYQTSQGLNSLNFRFKQARALLHDDPDIDVIGAFVTWQAGDTRLHEHAAALLCAHALQQEQQDFVLRPMAVQLLKNYLLNPLSDEEVTHMKSSRQEVTDRNKPRQILAASLIFWDTKVSASPIQNMTRGDLEKVLGKNVKVGDADSEGPLRHILQFDEAVRVLYRATVPAYMAWEDATAQLTAPNVTPEKKAGLAADQKKFARVIATSWKQFDAQIGAMNEQGGFLTAFRVNDTMFQHVDQFAAFSPNEASKYAYADHDALMKSLLEARFPTTIAGSPNKVRQMLDSDITRRRSADDVSLRDYETSLATFYQVISQASTDTQKFDAASAAAVDAAKLGLFGCGAQDCASGVGTKSAVEDIKVLMTKWIAPGFSPPADFAQKLDGAFMQRSLVFW